MSRLRRAILNGNLNLNQKLVGQPSDFNIHAFRAAAVTWLLENNHPLREFETSAFCSMLKAANPDAARALWKSP
jgi:hypothetical protein